MHVTADFVAKCEILKIKIFEDAAQVFGGRSDKIIAEDENGQREHRYTRAFKNAVN